ncbi:MAG: preprotein translocase subunit SecG, partial [Verrucomicrobiota bacterium]
LGAAFGGSTLDSALGAHTTDILQKITTWLLIIFFVCAIGLTMIKAREFRASAASNVLEAVEEREMELPALPPELQNIPSPATTLPADDLPAPALDDAPSGEPVETEEAPGGGEKAKAAKGDKAAPKEKSEAPKEKAKAPAEKGEAGE